MKQRFQQKNIVIDVDSCHGCRTCEVACKQEHDLPVGVKRVTVITSGPRWVGDRWLQDWVPMRCMHCGKPACVEACPVGAIEKRSDGIVLVDHDKCTGCMLCTEACPTYVPQLNPETNKIEICDMCVHKVDKGELPACVQHCEGSCMYFGYANQIITMLQKRYVGKIVVS
jgi:Fe-S-cluster-containing dehydrogenase component